MKRLRSKGDPQRHTHRRAREGGREGGKGRREDKEGRRETYRGSRHRSGGGLGLGGASTLTSRLRGFLTSRLDNRLLGSRSFFRRGLLARRTSLLGGGLLLWVGAWVWKSGWTGQSEYASVCACIEVDV